MNYLQLVNAVKKDAGIPGASLSTLSAANNEMQRIITWVDQSWNELQIKRTDWWWMRKSCTFTTVAGDNAYTAADAGVSDLSTWREETFRSYRQSAGVRDERRLLFMQYNDWRNTYALGYQPLSLPLVVSVAPDLSLRISPTPNEAYVVSGDYQTMPTALTVDADVPTGLPSQYHMLIAYSALMKYAMFEAAPEVFNYAKSQYDFYFSRVEENQLDDVTSEGALI